jgi:hypothetical protein
MKPLHGGSPLLTALLLSALGVSCGGEGTRASSTGTTTAGTGGASGAGGGATTTSSATTSSGVAGGGSGGMPSGKDGGLEDSGGGSGGSDAGAKDGSVTDGGGPVLAFPEAVGFARLATGGRGGTVVRVTNLNDSGAGSFRDAVSQGHRIVVFTVGGYINLASAVSVSSNLTIAGQTGTGDGIGFMGREVSFSGATNVIVRYLRFRQGSLDPDASKSGINLLNASMAIFDHVSVQFAQWNNVDAVGASNITIQSSIIADPIGQQFNAHTETGPYTWFGNVFANAHNRSPLAKANTQFVNNVVYNFQAGYTAGNSAGVFTHDIVANFFIAGPSTTNAGDAYFQMNGQSVYVSGNCEDSDKNGALGCVASGLPSGTTKLAAPWSPLTASLPSVSATAAYMKATTDAGASLHRDQVDTQVIADVTSLGKTGQLWTSQTATGLSNSGYGTLNGGTTPVDTDGDGMPDAWEKKYGLNPNDPSDASGDFDHTGYTNIEKYINGLADGSYPTN